MDAVKEVKAMWDEWKALPFPSRYGGKDVAGICVTSLDAYAAGCIHTFISCKGRLDDGRISILKKCRDELRVVVNELEGEARKYFNDLLLMSEKVFRLTSRPL